MRALPIGMNGTLIVISKQELAEMKMQAHNGVSMVLLEGGQGAPGYAIMVEDNDEHARRPKPGEIKVTRSRKPQKNGAKKQLMPQAASGKR